MHRARKFLAFVVLLVVATPASGAQAVRINNMLRPDGPIRNAPAQLVLTLDVVQPQPRASLTILAPPGFRVEEVRASEQGKETQSTNTNTVRVGLGTLQGRVTKVFMLHPPEVRIPRGKYRLLATVSTAPAPNVTVDSAPMVAGDSIIQQSDFDVEYIPAIPIVQYLLWGLLGVAVGYGIRLLVKVLSKIPEPIPLANDDGPITKFVKKYYFLVDCLVTLVLGLFVLLYLIKDGHVPDSAAYWYGAVVTGVGLGLLTNSELIVKLPRGRDSTEQRGHRAA
jgi:hypothetical protein